MATLWITVFEASANVAVGAPIEEQQVTIGASSLSSAAIDGSATQFRTARLMADADCHISWGESPTASTTTMPLGAENPEYIGIRGGDLIVVIERV